MCTPRWAVRIRRADGEITGTGILLSPDRVLTCAHVVKDRHAHFTAEFVGAASGREVPSVPAWVDEDAYVPDQWDADGDPSGDVALLRLEQPRPDRETTRLHRLSASHREVQTYGFPFGHNGGIWFRATIVGGCGRDGQVQLSPVRKGEVASPGCSGSGVMDVRTGKVIGMLLSSVRDEHGNGFSFMSPAETIVRHLPQLAQRVEGQEAVDDRLRPRRGDTAQAFDWKFAQRLARWLRNDGSRVKISVVHSDDTARDATLRRAITLADRELRTAASVERASDDPPDTIPSAGGHDLAVDATGIGSAEVGERILKRMGRWQHPADPVTERIRAADVTLTLVVVGVDEAEDPPALLDLLTTLYAAGNRLLLVFRHNGALCRRARRELVEEPEQQPDGEAVALLRHVTEELAQALSRRRARVLANESDAVSGYLVRAYLTLAALRARNAAAPWDRPRLERARYEHRATELAGRLNGILGTLDDLSDLLDELNGRMRAYQVLHATAVRGTEEDADLDAFRLHAQSLLRARPCDVRAAEAAVAEYIGAVERAIARGRQGGSPAS
ncbi:trypsin-like serine peptidase [Streptomyces sp. NPDC101166]|uniref:trypsin-like serine peptidase n=1 Tax=Streptomyces sp. NPDC101166 TaxID=3366120 RepID=UPI0037FD3AEC